MKKTLLFIFAALFVFNSFAESYKVEGYYNGINIYVNNPLLDIDESKYCITEVRVNGEEIPDEINSSTFRISLDKMGLDRGEKLSIVFIHGPGCEPELINFETLKPMSTFSLYDYNVSDNFLEWESEGESSPLEFAVEEFRWGKWIELDKVDGIGGPDNNTYKTKIYPHEGSNMYRIKQLDFYNKAHYSDTMRYQPEMEKVILETPKKAKGEVKFSGVTLYQLFNLYGERIKFGGGDAIDVSDVEKGNYILFYGNEEPVEIKIK